MGDVTLILSQIERGDGVSAERLFPLVYDELKRIAASKMLGERSDHTLQATALVHEAYVRLVDVEQAQQWKSRGHFFSAAAEAMRRILIESARQRKSLKRDRQQVSLSEQDLDCAVSNEIDAGLLLDLDAGLTKLAEEDPVAADLAKLRLFAGLSVTEAGEMQGLSRTAAYRNWEYIRSWFALYANK